MHWIYMDSDEATKCARIVGHKLCLLCLWVLASFLQSLICTTWFVLCGRPSLPRNCSSHCWKVVAVFLLVYASGHRIAVACVTCTLCFCVSPALSLENTLSPWCHARKTLHDYWSAKFGKIADVLLHGYRAWSLRSFCTTALAVTYWRTSCGPWKACYHFQIQFGMWISIEMLLALPWAVGSMFCS